MEELKFDLQLFADDAGGDNFDQAETQSEEAQQEGFDFAIDDDGNVVFADGDEFDFEQDSSDVEEEQPQTPETYTVKVGGEDVEVTMDELMNGYMRTADYTRKTQALAEERRMLAQQTVPQQQQPSQQVSQEPQAQEPDIKEYYRQLAEYAKGQVEHNLGAEYDEFNPVHVAALADEVANVKSYIVQQQIAQQEQQATMNEFAGMYQKYAQDPNFHEIDRMAQEELQRLPYNVATKVMEAVKTYNTPVVDEYMAAIRDKYYGRLGTNSQAKPQAKPKPPYAEASGQGTTQELPRQKFDPRQLGRMSLDQQAAVFSKLGLSDL